jgi:acetoin utilization protein AcuB
MNKFKKVPSVGSVMTPFPYFVDADASVADVEALMAEHKIRHVPVQQNGVVVGIVSERDLRRQMDSSLAPREKKVIRAREVMVDRPFIVAFDTPLNAVVTEMAARHIGSALVLRHDKLAGILSVGDVCRILAEILDAEFPPPKGNDAA